MSLIVRQLRELRALLDTGWTQNAMARDATGKEVDREDPSAVSFCLLGGLRMVGGESTAGIRECLSKVLPPTFGLVSFNDNSTKNEVLALIDKAIAYAEGQL
jgi:hypothetical protein